MNAPIRSMAGLVEALRQRRDELDVSNETLDAIAGLPERYTAKLLAPRAPRNMSYNSLGLILGALGVGLQVVDDEEQAKRVSGRWQKRKPQGPRYQPTLLLAPPDSGRTTSLPTVISEGASIAPNLQKLAELLTQLTKEERILAGASKGGKRRAKALGKRARQRIASHAARKRWAKRGAATP